MTGYIRLSRKICSWKWYNHPSTLIVFLHVLLNANYEDKIVKGMTIKRGQYLTTCPDICLDTYLDTCQVRNAIRNLISTGELSQSLIGKSRLLTVLKYNDYQAPIMISDEKKQDAHPDTYLDTYPVTCQDTCQDGGVSSYYKLNNINNIYTTTATTTAREAVNAWEREIGTCSPTVMEKLTSYDFGEHTADIIARAISEAVKYNVKNLAYVEGILDRYMAEGVKCLADIRERGDKRDNKHGGLDKNSRDGGELQLGTVL